MQFWSFVILSQQELTLVHQENLTTHFLLENKFQAAFNFIFSLEPFVVINHKQNSDPYKNLVPYLIQILLQISKIIEVNIN